MPRPAPLAVRRAVVGVCRRLYERGLIAGQDGNVSVRVGSDRLLVTPAGASKADLSAADLVEISLDGRTGRRGTRPTSELAMHLRFFRLRPDIRAVVHAHPPAATAFAVAGAGLTPASLAELAYNVGPVPLVPYGRPGTEEVADRLEPFIADHDAFLLAHHGATTVGRTLRAAHQRMESLEHAARILLAARLLGGGAELPAEEVAALLAGGRSARRR